MPILYVVGGRAKPNARELKEFHGFERAIILEIDTETKKATEVAGWCSPQEACPDEQPSFVFKAATLTSEYLWVCTQTEVICYSVPDFQIRHYLSLPFFNDLHHVRPTSRGTLLVAVTGLDMVAEISREGATLNAWNVLGAPLWGRFSQSTDYRKVATTKPHQSHPNYVFEYEDTIWATRFNQKDAIALTGPSRRIPIEVGGPHDGHVDGHHVHFTTVNGNIVTGDLRSCKTERVIDLYDHFDANRGQPLGWCRGIKYLAPNQVCLGFSRLRPTIIRDSLLWVRDRVLQAANSNLQSSRAMPTRVACFDLEYRSILWEMNLERYGLNAIFSIHQKGNPDIDL